jgi:hypothetical protein
MDEAAAPDDEGGAVRHRASYVPGVLAIGGWGSYAAERPAAARLAPGFLADATKLTPPVPLPAAPRAAKPAAGLTLLALVVVAAVQVAWVALLLSLLVRVAYA